MRRCVLFGVCLAVALGLSGCLNDWTGASGLEPLESHPDVTSVAEAVALPGDAQPNEDKVIETEGEG